MSDLAQQIRDRLGGLAPASLTVEFPKDWTDEQREQFKAEFKATPAAVPPVFLEPAEPLSPEAMERWQETFDELLPEGATVHQIRILPPGPRFYPGFEQMRDAILGVLDEHQPVPCGNVRHDRGDGQHCAVCEYDDIERSWWPCPTVRAIVEKLGIEVGNE